MRRATEGPRCYLLGPTQTSMVTPLLLSFYILGPLGIVKPSITRHPKGYNAMSMMHLMILFHEMPCAKNPRVGICARLLGDWRARRNDCPLNESRLNIKS
jgi:hypothetical protein